MKFNVSLSLDVYNIFYMIYREFYPTFNVSFFENYFHIFLQRSCIIYIQYNPGQINPKLCPGLQVAGAQDQCITAAVRVWGRPPHISIYKKWKIKVNVKSLFQSLLVVIVKNWRPLKLILKKKCVTQIITVVTDLIKTS